MAYGIVAVVIAIIIILLTLTKSGAKRRNLELDRWGASIPVSEAQQEVMSILWDAAQAKKPPQIDPLLSLSEEDRQYLFKICSADFRPARFGDSNALRFASFNSLMDDDFNAEQAAIIVGMIFNSVGRKKLSHENNEEKTVRHNRVKAPIERDWALILNNVDFKATTFEIRRMFSSQVNYAKAQHQELYMKEELNEALTIFLDHPCFDTAVALLEVSPELMPFFTDPLIQQ